MRVRDTYATGLSVSQVSQVYAHTAGSGRAHQSTLSLVPRPSPSFSSPSIHVNFRSRVGEPGNEATLLLLGVSHTNIPEVGILLEEGNSLRW